jgi:chromobox protein 1
VPSLKRSKSKKSLRENQPPTDSPAPNKRRKRNGAKETSAAADEEDEGTWTPSGQNWEAQVDRIDTVEKADSGQLLAYILFKNGRKTKIGMDKVYVHCPVSMLKFYENHLKFK